MISLLLTKFKNILLLLLIGAMVFTTNIRVDATSDTEYIKVTVMEETVETIAVQPRLCDIVIRVGEYEGKAGKRIYINNQTVNLPDDIPVRNDGDGNGFYVSEWDINLKEAKAIAQKLQAKGINVRLQVAYTKSEDLNAAARIANKANPYLYVSVHHNYYEDNSTGYFSMYNPNNQKSKELANRLSNAIQDNGQIRRMADRENTGYIGELNTIHGTTAPALLELGFFSNIAELEKICSDSYVDYVSTQLANELANIIMEDYK